MFVDKKIFLKHKNSAKVHYHELLKKALMDGIQPTKEGMDKLLSVIYQTSKRVAGDSLAVWWLGLLTFIVEGHGSVPC